MRKRLLSLLLTLCLLCCLFAGCAKQQTPAAEAPAETSTEAPAAEAPPAPETEAPADTQQPEAAPEAEAPIAEGEAAAEESADGIDAFTSGATHTERADITGTYNDDGTYTSTGGITYPLFEQPLEVDQWSTIGMFDQGIDSYNDLPLRQTIAEKTGILINFLDISSSAQSEQFQLAVAADSLPEICAVAQLYTGGITAAYADEVVWDLTDYIDENAPDWWECVQLSTPATIDSVYSNGMILQISGIRTAYEVDQGLFTNGKFLEQYNTEQGCEAGDIKNLQSLGGFTTYLKWIKDVLNPTYVTILDTTGAYTDIGNTFGTGIYSIGSTAAATFLEGDTVVSGLISDGYYNYLTWANEMYSYGVFDQDFYLADMAEQEEYMYIGTGQEGVWNNQAASQSGVAAYEDREGEKVVSKPLAQILNDQGAYTFGTEQTLTRNAWSITSTADEDVMKSILQYLNYFFTEPGFVYGNWGKECAGFEDPEGSFYYDENGEPKYNQVVYEGLDTWALWKNCWKEAPFYEDPMVHYQTAAAAEQLEAVAVWTYPDYEVTTEHTIPNGAALTTEENSTVATLLTDLCTYADECILKFIIGTQELNEQTWAEFGQQLENGYHLSQIVEVYQFAYDDYLAGNRTSVASAAAPPPPPPA